MNNKRAVIFANGAAGNLQWLASMLQPDDLLIAADGGLHHLMVLNLWPQVLIGDLDSVKPEEIELAEQNNVIIQRYSVDKNETDLQLALEYSLAAGCTTIVIAAALGGRVDHLLGNLFLLTRPSLDGIDVRLDDGLEEVFLINRQAEIPGEPGDIISLLPYCQPAEDVKTENLRYPLDFETLYPDQTRGISNVMETKCARVSISRGTLICVHTRKSIPV